jgi:hypothetical protein
MRTRGKKKAKNGRKGKTVEKTGGKQGEWTGRRERERERQTPTKKKAKKKKTEREETGDRKKQQGRDKNQFSSPEIKQKKKRLATVLAISNTGEKNIQKREKEQERRGSETEGEGNKIEGRRQRPEILHRVSASLRTGKSAFVFFFFASFCEEYCTARR